MEDDIKESETRKVQEDSAKDSKKGFNPLIIVGTLGLAVLIGLYAFRGRSVGPSGQTSPQVQGSQSVQESAPSGPVKELTVDGSNFTFNPNTINVNKGDTVKITFKDDDGTHNLVIDGYNVSTNTIHTGDSATVQFVADKTGTFAYYCSVDSHREKGMVGKLIVQ